MTTERIKQSLLEEAQRNLGLSKLAAVELQKSFLSKAQELQAAIEIIELYELSGRTGHERNN